MYIIYLSSFDYLHERVTLKRPMLQGGDTRKPSGGALLLVYENINLRGEDLDFFSVLSFFSLVGFELLVEE